MKKFYRNDSSKITERHQVVQLVYIKLPFPLMLYALYIPYLEVGFYSALPVATRDYEDEILLALVARNKIELLSIAWPTFWIY